MGLTIALAGNPNVGKSTLFNALTGLRQHTGNWAGKTVELAEGTVRVGTERHRIIDLPGAYSLDAHSREEEIARECVASGAYDCVITVADASRPDRGIAFALEIMRHTNRVVLALNMCDDASRRGVTVDCAKLSDALGIPVVPITARRRRGLDALLNAAMQVSARDISVARTEYDPVLYAEKLCNDCVTYTHASNARDRKLDRVFTGKLGYATMFALLAVVLWITLAGANVPSALLSSLFSRGNALLLHVFDAIRAPWWLTRVLVDGVYLSVTWVVSVMLPPMAIFFPLFTLLEDFGYLPRVAYNLDRGFERADSCGKQSLTMCMGLGCNACGVIGCRIIDSPRRKLVAMLTNALVPCNGRFPLIIAMIAMVVHAAGFAGTVLRAALLAAVVAFGVVLTLLCSKLLTATVLRGESTPFILELPPYRAPRVGSVIVRSMLDRTLFVLGRAVAVAAPAGLVVWLLANVSPDGVSLLARAAQFLDATGRFFGMDGVILLAFVIGFPANEIVIPALVMGYTAGGALTDTTLAELHALLAAHGWTRVTAICVALFALAHFPCSTTLLTIKHETGSAKWTALAAILPTIVGLSLCAAVTWCARLLGFG
ncbi:MAG: ferrous iron transporter B [Oscillospiraceae bacterium]|nr:ferrous iron transporter B [Oscillospiraceae bacterium]